MMKKLTPHLNFLLTLAILFIASVSFTQVVVKGNVSDDETGEALIGANVSDKATSTGTTTDALGNFMLEVSSLPITLVVSYVGYEPQEMQVDNEDEIKITLREGGINLDDIVIVGARFRPRTMITSPVPIDNVKMEDMITTGQQSFDKMLHYSVPSFNSTQQTISDATAHFDPADLRGLGPSRTLVLINGKRKNASSLVYINDTPGKGEVGVDMKSIPVAAIERIEVLRDGASAQYGSDAIAGVINIILKDDYEFTDVNLFSGITTEGDGFSIGYNINTGFKLGKKGYVNLTTSYSNQEETNRAGEPGKDDLFGVDASNPWIQKNPGLGMTVGTPNMTTADVFFNMSLPVTEEAEIYSFGGLVYRKGISYALYRAPYWVPDPHNIFHKPGEEYQGFQPSFEGDIFDNTFAVGVRGQKNEWKYDLSTIFGGNIVDYTVNNSLNIDLGAQSPTSFRPGGYEFRNQVSNLDLSRQIESFTISFGTEFRTENFVTNPGDEASYFNETGSGGAQSFPGLQPQNAIDVNRYNVGFYVDAVLDITEDLLIGGAARFEKYSDFGETFNWKANARYKFLDDKISIRASASTGFRAPSLHQIYLSNVQTLISGGTVSNQGTFNNESSVIRSLEVPKLKEEQATNYSFGFAAKPAKGLYVSVDYYSVAVDDRIVYSSSISTDDTTTLVYQILDEAQITSLKFFTNAVNTTTSGVDIVANYSTQAGPGVLGINLSANFNETKIEGQIATPKPIADAKVDIFDRKEQSRIISARPNNKILFGLSYKIKNFTAVVNNTYFGEVTWQHVDNGLNGAPLGPNGSDLPTDDAAYDQTFGAKIVTDLYLDYRFSKTVGLSIAVNNLLNVYPDKINTVGDFVTDLGGRFQYPWEVNQFGFNGTIISGKLNIRF